MYYVKINFKIILSYVLQLLLLLLLLFLERGEGREEEKERNINVWLPCMHLLLGTWPSTQALTGNRTVNPLVLQANTQSTEPHQPGPTIIF